MKKSFLGFWVSDTTLNLVASLIFFLSLLAPFKVFAASSAPVGVYSIVSGSSAIDGGFGKWNQTPSVQLYANTPSDVDQQWIYSSGRTLQLQDSSFPKYLVDAKNGSMGESTSGDTFTILPVSGGYTIQDDQTKNYLVYTNGTLQTSTSSASNAVWNLNAVPVTGLAYSIITGSSAIDGGFGKWNDTPSVQLYANTPSDVDQQWIYSSGRTLQLQDSSFPKYLVDAKNGSMGESTSGDTFTILPVSGGYTIQDDQTKNYLVYTNGTLQTSTSSASNAAWNFSIDSSAPVSAPAGVYSIVSGSYAVDGGFGKWNQTPSVQLYANTPTDVDQQWIYSSGRTLQLQDSSFPKYLVDAKNGSMGESTAGDTFTILVVSGGYTIQDDQTKNYLINNNGVLQTSTSSSSNAIWSLNVVSNPSPTPTPTPTPVPTPTPAPTGVYSIVSGSYAVDGGFGKWNQTPSVQLYANTPTDVDQQWIYSSGRTLQLQDSSFPEYMIDAKNGSMGESTSGDTFTIIAVSGGYTIQDDQTKNYLINNNGVLQTSTSSASDAVWSLNPVSSNPTPTPTATPSPTPSPTPPAYGISVTNYGATGNGSTDDTAAIQNAVNACSSSCTAVSFPAGTYKMSNFIMLQSGVSMQGTSAVLSGGGFGSSTGVSNLTISGFTFNNAVIDFYGSGTESNITITNNLFENVTVNTGNDATSAIIFWSPSTNTTISNNTFTNIFYQGTPSWVGGNAVTMNDSTYLTITGNTFTNINQAIGSYAHSSNSHDVTITYNTISQNYRYNIEVQANYGVNNVNISNNTIRNYMTQAGGVPINGQAGISLAVGGTGHVITNNLINGPNLGYPNNQSDSIEAMGTGFLIQNNYGTNAGEAQLIGYSDNTWITNDNIWCGMTDPNSPIIYLEAGGLAPGTNTNNQVYSSCSSAPAVPSGVGSGH